MTLPAWLHKEGIGRWFNPDNYRPSRDPEYWANMISARLGYVDFLKDYPESFELQVMQFRDLVIGSFEESKSGTYVPDSVMLHELDYIGYSQLASTLSNSDEFVKHDHWFTETERLMDQHAFNGGITKHLEQNGVNRLELDDELVGSIQTAVRMRHTRLSDFEALSSSRKVHLVVDVEQDDESLVEEFLELLYSKRGRKKRKVSEVKFANWYTAGVLPCFDLVCWSALLGHSPTNVQLGEWIWPNGNLDRAERVRKTTKPNIDIVITHSMLKRIDSLIDR